MIRRTIAGILLFTSLVALNGCGTSSVNKADEEGNRTNIVSQDVEKKDDNEINTKEDSASDIKVETGRYVGQIDSNSIEIKIGGVPDESSAKAFRLGDQIKGEFDKLGLETGDVIRVTYVLNEYNQPVISEIEKK